MQYNIINYSHYIVPYISMTYWLYNWKFVLLDPVYPIPIPYSPTTNLFSLSMSLVFCLFVCFVFWIPYISEIKLYLFILVGHMKLARMAHLTIIIKRQFLDINGKKWCQTLHWLDKKLSTESSHMKVSLPIIQNLHWYFTRCNMALFIL